MYARFALLPDQAQPLQRSWLMAALSAGSKIIQLRHRNSAVRAPVGGALSRIRLSRYANGWSRRLAGDHAQEVGGVSAISPGSGASGADGSRTLPWREPDSNHRSPLVRPGPEWLEKGARALCAWSAEMRPHP
jgi:hypothetical protein